MVKFKYSNKDNLILAIRNRYEKSTGIETIKIAKWFVNNMTIQELRSLLGNAAANKLAAKADKYDSIISEKGE